MHRHLRFGIFGIGIALILVVPGAFAQSGAAAGPQDRGIQSLPPLQNAGELRPIEETPSQVQTQAEQHKRFSPRKSSPKSLLHRDYDLPPEEVGAEPAVVLPEPAVTETVAVEVAEPEPLVLETVDQAAVETVVAEPAEEPVENAVGEAAEAPVNSEPVEEKPAEVQAKVQARLQAAERFQRTMSRDERPLAKAMNVMYQAVEARHGAQLEQLGKMIEKELDLEKDDDFPTPGKTLATAQQMRKSILRGMMEMFHLLPEGVQPE
ncbi:MAG: hypothetical protein JW937_01120 [Candidatus Omnitrophica bacterium]|nr:hypothetical protein [Candidatus Omnitrophota bacterium]